MFRLTLPTIAAALALGACAGAPPSGPGVVATAGRGKDVVAFRQDDAACRQAGAQASATGIPPQQRYDTAYAQCMCTKGERIELASRAYPLIATGLTATISMRGGGPR